MRIKDTNYKTISTLVYLQNACILVCAMLCYVMWCDVMWGDVMWCDVMLRYVTSRHVTLRFVSLRYVTLRSVLFCSVLFCCFVLCCVVLCCVVFCCVVLCCVVLCCVVLCYVMLRYVMLCYLIVYLGTGCLQLQTKSILLYRNMVKINQRRLPLLKTISTKLPTPPQIHGFQLKYQPTLLKEVLLCKVRPVGILVPQPGITISLATCQGSAGPV